MSAEMLAERKEKKKQSRQHFQMHQEAVFNFFSLPHELYSDPMLWNFEPSSLSGF